MAKIVKPFGETVVSAAVKRFLDKHGIHPNDVRSYSVRCEGGSYEVITLEMYFEDVPEKKEEGHG